MEGAMEIYGAEAVTSTTSNYDRFFSSKTVPSQSVEQTPIQIPNDSNDENKHDKISEDKLKNEDVNKSKSSYISQLVERMKSKKTKENTTTTINSGNSSTKTTIIASSTGNISTNISDNNSIINYNNTINDVPYDNVTNEPNVDTQINTNAPAINSNNTIKNNNNPNIGSVSIDNQSLKAIPRNGGTFAIVSISMIIIVGIVCAAYFVVKRRKKMNKKKLNDEDILDNESYSIPLNKVISKQGSEAHSKYSHNGNTPDCSISLNDDNNSQNHPLPTIPVQNEEANKSYDSQSRKQSKAGLSERINDQDYYPSTKYGNNNSSQYVIDSIASTQYPPQYTITAQYQENDQYSASDRNQADTTQYTSLSQNQIDNSQYTTNSQSPQANQYVNETTDNQVTSNSSKYIFDDQDDDDSSSSSSPGYGFDAMDHQTLSQSSKYLYDSIDRNLSVNSRSIFDSMENLKLSQSSKNLLESKNINLSQSIYDSLDNSSQNHVFDPNNSSIDIYATEAVISFSNEEEAGDVKHTRKH